MGLSEENHFGIGVEFVIIKDSGEFAPRFLVVALAEGEPDFKALLDEVTLVSLGDPA